eukprot:TRINITY_DN103_c1_g2_i1.p1 TRINITY_DN103_c1_g2~~TRINITY_DN103_c1_g2_i1.p1  ORF type:complete len:617 (-),score=189.14 TRINITY_DN103_c1_g2_i1:1958-3808(-)
MEHKHEHKHSGGKDRKRKHKEKQRHRKESDSDSDGFERSKRSRSPSEEKEEKRRKEKRRKPSHKSEKKHKKGDHAKLASSLGYTNEENPFGDPRLTDRFVWRKKVEGEKQNQSLEERLKEIESVRARRLRREEERRILEDERERMERQAEMSSYFEWKMEEDEFHKKQELMRSELRIKRGNAKPIDIFSRNFRLLFVLRRKEILEERHEEPTKQDREDLLELDDREIEIQAPNEVIESLDSELLRGLVHDIGSKREILFGLDPSEDPMSSAPKEVTDEEEIQKLHFWDCLSTVAKYELEKRERQEKWVQEEVRPKVDEMVREKDLDEVQKIREDVRKRIASGDSQYDMGFWEEVMHQLDVEIAKLQLQEMHEDLLMRQLQHLESMKGESEKDVGRGSGSGSGEEPEGEDGNHLDAKKDEQMDEADKPETSAQDELATALRKHDQATVRQLMSQMSSQEKRLMEDAMHMMGPRQNLDEILKAQSPAEAGLVYHRDDKYRTRQPNHFNRVHTRYEWNSYNRVHYDHENPPPKTITGYKFNIFYPDLIDKTTTPRFVIHKSKTPGECFIRFSAGPPYEDIVFRIVDRPWEKSHRRGFRCTFERGVLHLFFNFKRMRYRR